MKVNELLERAQTELNAEKQEEVVATLKERLQEIAAAKNTLNRMETQLNELLAKSLDEV